MERIIIIVLAIMLIWTLCFFLHILNKQGQELEDEKGKRVDSQESIMGKCRYEVSHSKPLVPSYPESENSGDKRHIFASETKSNTSGDAADDGEKGNIMVEGIDEVPLYEATEDSLTMDKETEERSIPRSTESEAEYARGMDAANMFYTLSVIAKSNATLTEQRGCAALLPLLENTELMSKLQSNKVYAKRIEDIVNSQYVEPSKSATTDDPTKLDKMFDLDELLNVKQTK